MDITFAYNHYFYHLYVAVFMAVLAMLTKGVICYFYFNWFYQFTRCRQSY